MPFVRNFALGSVLLSASCALAQQTLGSIAGTVTDPAGRAVPAVTILAVEQGTQLTRSAVTSAQGSYSLPDLPVGTYTVTFSREGFAAQRVPNLVVQLDRTVTLPVQLSLGEVATEVTVQANPLLNASDTTNGYVLEKQQIENVPQPTGSFTGLAVLSPGVNTELPGGTGVNSGLGNLPIWANGQRDTSNSFLLNGVDGSTLFNGKSTSQVPSGRLTSSTGAGLGGGGGVVQSSASLYLSIGNALPTPAPEMLDEERVNASMYTADQGSTSGAHIDLSTASGTNAVHGRLYARRGTDWLNAAPFFFKNDPGIPESLRKPQLHRYVAGGTLGAPLIKDKLFAFFGYQHQRVSDQEVGDSFLTVPVGLSDDRAPAALAAISNAEFGTSLHATDIDSADRRGIAQALFNSPALPGEPGRWLIPNATGPLSFTHPFNAFLPGTARFYGDQAVADIDYNASAKDTFTLKYYYQHDPTAAPYAYSNVPGFTQHLDAGAQVFSIENTYLLKQNLSTQQTLGFVREKIYSSNEQPFGPDAIPGAGGSTTSMNVFGSKYFPGISIVNVLGNNEALAGTQGILNIGPNAEAQGSNTGVFQNRVQPSASALWTVGRHTLGFGASYSYTQLNTLDRRTGTGTVTADDFSNFVQGLVTPGGATTGFYVTSFLQGNANRYFRAGQLGTYLQDKFQVTATLALTAGLRYDWNGGLSEKYGRLFNFDPRVYQYDSTTDTIVNPGFIIAGNNANGTPGVSATTLTGRQWGLAPRLGAAWQPAALRNKMVVRAGLGMYYDRGELYSYFSPPYAIGTVTGGTFGVNQALPFVTAQTCPVSTQFFYQGYMPTCGGSDAAGNLANPFGATQIPGPQDPKAADLVKYLPNAAAIAAGAGQPISLGIYDRNNKLPYTINYTLDVQWQPRVDLVIDLGYVGNVGRHQIVPVPFNQPVVASPSNPTLKGSPFQQNYSYGYTVQGATLPNGSRYLATYEGGNMDLRVPYIGYAAESIDYRAAGVDAYNALQARIDKRMSHNVQVGVSYTYSHALDEHSGLGLFYNGNNTADLRDGYASSDFDRTHVLTINYIFRLPDLYAKNSLRGAFTNGWSLVGLAVIESGQPYSVIDYTGAIASLYYSTNNGVTNSIVPLAPGCTAKNARTGKSGAFGDRALRPECFLVQPLAPGAYGGAVPTSDLFETDFTKGQRNIFRQAFQKRADASIVKETPLGDRVGLRYTLDVYNLTNTASLDIPGNTVSENLYFNNFPVAGAYPGGVAPGSSTCSTDAGRLSAEPYTGTYFYNCADNVGVVAHTIGSARQVQMSLALTF